MPVLTVDYTAREAPSLFTRSLKETGFAVLRSHPISTDLINEIYRLWQQFFLAREEEKLIYLYQKPSQAGYFPFRTENAKGSKLSDLKEFFHFYPWGTSPPALRAITLEMYDALHLLAAELLQWIEDFLPDNVKSQLSIPLKEMLIDSPNTLLRILHYPALEEETEGAVRAAPHEDINLITLLPAATAPGLEVLDTKNQWHPVSCDPGSIVVNVGDMLQMCTQKYYLSTTHRVTNPIGDEKRKARFSMPLFLHPGREVYLAKNLMAKEYLKQRLHEIGIY